MKIAIIIAVLGISYLVISNYIRFKKSKKPISEVIYKVVEIIYPTYSRRLQILNHVNIHLASIKRKPRVSDSFLTTMAKRRVSEISFKKLSHSGVADEFIELQLKGSDGEVELLGAGYRTPNGVVNGWINSSEHYKAMINPSFDACGIGCKKGENGKWIDVMLMINEKTLN